MDRRQFLAGLAASAAAIPVIGALPSVGSAANILDCGAASLNDTKIWLIAWGEYTCSAVYPKGSKGGLDFRLPVTKWRSVVEKDDFRNEIIDDIPYKEISVGEAV